MFALIVIISTAVPLLCGLALLLAFPARPFGWTSYAAWAMAVAAVLCALSRVVRWDFFGYAGPSATVALLAFTFFARGYLAGAELRWTWPDFKVRLVSLVCAAAAGLILFAMHRIPGDDAVALQMPLQDARWHVAHGGSMKATNHHVAVPAQRFAIDLSAVGPDGRRASESFFPRDLAAYVAFGKTVASPCDGVIAASEHSKPDLPVGQMDPDSPAGNFVAVDCKGVVVVMAHLQQGSIALGPGTAVRTGQALGRIGNSGNTSEPHLHVHAVRGPCTTLDALLFEGTGVPMTFDGRFLLRGDSGPDS